MSASLRRSKKDRVIRLQALNRLENALQTVFQVAKQMDIKFVDGEVWLADGSHFTKDDAHELAISLLQDFDG